MITEPSTVNLGPFSASDAEMTPWSTTVDALRRCQKYWLSTVRPDGRPHVTPLLATVALEGLCFVTGDNERKANNLRANSHVVLTTGVNTLTGIDYVIEGTATRVTHDNDLDTAAATFENNFGWHLTDPDGNWFEMSNAIRSKRVGLYQVLPSRAFAFGNGKAFSQTRYIWDSPNRD